MKIFIYHTDEDFRTTMESYKNRTADFVGRSDEVMTSLITTVAKEVDDPVLSSYIEETQSTEEHTADDVAESPADTADTIEEIARKVQEEEPVQAPENGYMPDPSMSIEAMNAYGGTRPRNGRKGA